jgi:exonuclease SbcD
MRILHTSDWHIGQSLYGRKRYQELEQFLDWLAEILEKEQVDALLVAGDVFDNTTPSNRAQELYYRFLHRTAASRCRHVVVTAGNHDSPSFLNAPKEILKFLNVHVFGCAADSPADEVLVLSDTNGDPELIVCAIPYLRDSDVRRAETGESVADKGRKLIEGIRSHYRQVCEAAQEIRFALNRSVPIVAMGHLFAAGGQTADGEVLRELYVGSLAHVGMDVFPESIDYLALGHLHAPQRLGGSERMRYSGSPLPMGFGEAEQEKRIFLVDFSDSHPAVTAVPVPRFQILERVRGDWNTLNRRIGELKTSGSRAWLEIVYEGRDVAVNLSERLDEAIAGSKLEILCVKNSVLSLGMSKAATHETLEALGIDQVFLRCLDAHAVPEAQRSDLLGAYREAIACFHDEDPLAE